MLSMPARVLAILAAAVLPAVARPVPAQDTVAGRRGPKPPNVLLVVLDDLNDWVGPLGGHPQAATPHLDRFAATAVTFTRAVCAAGSCNPSRTALFTGRTPRSTGLLRNVQDMREVLPDEVLLPRHLANHGYRALGGGKLLHYFVDPRSWDDYFPSIERRSPFPRTLYPEQRPVSLPREPWMYVETDWGPLDATLDEYGGDYLVANWARGELAQDHELPRFVAAGIYRPHEPWFVPRPYFDRFPLEDVQLPPGVLDGDLDDLPPAGRKRGPNRYLAHIREHGQWRAGVQGYLASIAFADDMLGRILEAVDSGPRRDDTVVIVTSDHGWHLGEKEHWQKFTGWWRCARVPLFVRVPPGYAALVDGTPAGARCDAPVTLLDLFPTICELAGVPPKDELGGESLLPRLRDPGGASDRVVATWFGHRDAIALTGPRYRYIHYPDGGEELYDLDADPHEWRNLAGDAEHVDVLTAMRAALPGD